MLSLEAETGVWTHANSLAFVVITQVMAGIKLKTWLGGKEIEGTAGTLFPSSCTWTKFSRQTIDHKVMVITIGKLANAFTNLTRHPKIKW